MVYCYKSEASEVETYRVPQTQNYLHNDTKTLFTLIISREKIRFSRGSA